MFSAGFLHRAMVINTINIRRINLHNIEDLRRLFIQILHNPCHKIILDIKGVKFIDSTAFAAINELIAIAQRHNTHFAFTNVDPEVLELFQLNATSNKYCIEESLQLNEIKQLEVIPA